MADVVSMGTYFTPEVKKGLINRVKGESLIAQLSGQEGIPFLGEKEYVFNMTDEVDLVAENGKKSRAGIEITPRTIAPLKIEYGFRTSMEFMTASEEYRFNIIGNFVEGFAKKAARGLDIMAFHGVNPRSGSTSTLIGDNYFEDTGVEVVNQTVGDPNEQVQSAISKIQANGYDVDGIALSPTYRAELAELKWADGHPMFPELNWGKMSGTLNGINAACGNTVSFGQPKEEGDPITRAIVGDWSEAFKWGYSLNIPAQIIKYGDPDNSGMDLQGYNQIYIRAELFLGWGILDKGAFVVIQGA